MRCTVPVTLRLRDSPVAGRNGLCARVQDRFRGAGVPRIVQQQRRAFDVELGKTSGFFDLVRFAFFVLRQPAIKRLRPRLPSTLPQGFMPLLEYVASQTAPKR